MRPQEETRGLLHRIRLHRIRGASTTSIITFAVVAAVVVFVFIQLNPSLLFAKTTPAGGDMGAHVWGPNYMRHHLLPHWRLTGWAPDWYAGFPAYTFYFPLPSLLIALLSFVLPYGVAFKVVTVLGLVTLPIAAWAFGRLARVPFPGPALLAVASLPFLFDRGFTIYGGNIASTLAGEFSFSISLSLALVFLGVVARGLETGRHRALAGVLLALVGLSHILPTLFALVGAVVLFALRPGRRRLQFVVTVLAVGGLIAAFWAVPTLLRVPYATNMGWEKLTQYHKNVLPPNLRWVIALAAAGALASFVLRRTAGLALTAMAVITAIVFIQAPEGRLWNARALPFLYLCYYLLAGLAIAEAAGALARLRVVRVPIEGRRPRQAVALEVDEDDDAPPRPVVLAAPVVALALALIVVALPLRILPFGHLDAASGKYQWMGLSTKDSSFIPSWVKWNYSGYEGKPAYPEYRDVVSTMARVGREHGCGRAHWEYESNLDRFGTPMALMLLPYWTDGCIGSMEGLYFESSATTPFHFLNAAELSKAPSNPHRDLPYTALDLDTGVRHMQLLGTRYYMAFSDDAVREARLNPDLQEVATVRRWHVFQVRGSELVTPLTNRPAVLEGVGGARRTWLDATVGWYQDPSQWDVPLAAGGPRQWPRVAVRGQRPAPKVVQGQIRRSEYGTDIRVDTPPRIPVPPARVSRIRTGDDRISFDVDRPGTPVLVKASYFPNWQVSGAKGPWRVSPNLMVVLPTSRHVSLHYGWTPVDLAGLLLTVLGLAAAVLLARRPALAVDDAPPEGDAEVTEGQEGTARERPISVAVSGSGDDG